MRLKISILLLIGVCAAGAFGRQQSVQPERKRVVVLPREIWLSVIARQVDCPLQFESATAVLFLDGGLGYNIQLRNTGKKPIRDFTIAEINSTGTRALLSFPARTPNDWIMPGQIAPRTQADSEPEIVPLTDELRTKLGLRGDMQGLLVFMVVRVEFADGATYSDEPAYEALKTFFVEHSIWSKQPQSSSSKK